MNQTDSATKSITRPSAPNAEPQAVLYNDKILAMTARPILVAVDVSWESRGALIWACRHAALVDAPVTVLHVLHDPSEAPGKYSSNPSDPLMPMWDRAEKMISEFMAEARETHRELEALVDAQTKTLSGLPAQTIVSEAVRLDAILIVVGSRGHTGLPRLMYGSTAQRVMQLSPIPVTVVKAMR